MTAKDSLGSPDICRIAVAQIAPVWLNRDYTLAKVLQNVQKAADSECHLVAFGEALVPGYPFWIERTDGARYNSPIQKEIHAHYARPDVTQLHVNRSRQSTLTLTE
jgi:nitrilase